MLVLSRKKEEAIRIGDDITIKVIAVKGGGVRLGIEAPRDISIVRSELLPVSPVCDNTGCDDAGHPVSTNRRSGLVDNSDPALRCADGV